MGAVADRAEVTRALVYKHFANRDDILTALYQREARALDRELRRKVAGAPDGLEPKLRAFIHGVLEAVGTHSELFVPLRPFGQDKTQKREQRAWDKLTVRFFTDLAVDELGMEERVARAALGILLSGLSSLLEQARANRTPAHHLFLEDLFVEITVNSLHALARAH